MDYTKELAELKARHARELKELETRRRREAAVVTLQANSLVDDPTLPYSIEIAFPDGLDFSTKSELAKIMTGVLDNLIEGLGFKEVKWLTPKSTEEPVESSEPIEVKNVKKLASKIVTTLLIDGLGNSTWKDNNGFAYNALLKYRDDMEASVEKVLNKERK